MEKIFKNAKDKNVAAVVLYIDDGTLYYDAAFENAVEYKEDAIDLFINGAVIFDSDVYNRPLSVSKDGVMTYGEIETSELPARPEPELPEDIHTIPENKWNNPEESDEGENSTPSEESDEGEE